MALPDGLVALGSFQGERGPEGPAGPANTLTIGTVETVLPGAPARAWITGMAPFQLLNLELPRGINAGDIDSEDGTVAALLGTRGTESYDALTSRLQAYSSAMTIESQTDIADVSDSDAWARALAASQAFGIRKVQGTRADYYFHEPVKLSGVNSVAISGMGGQFTTIHAQEGAGELPAAFLVTEGDADAGNISITSIGFDGGMTNWEALGTSMARDERTFAPDRLLSGISIFGDLVPGTEGIYPHVENVTIRDVVTRGTRGLPVFIGGVAGHVSMTESFSERCLDIGFVFNESVNFTNNRVRFSADNGVSLSRGNKAVVCVGNSFYGSARYGVWAAGFGASPGPGGIIIPTWVGPEDITIVANNIVMSGWGGITLAVAPQNVTVTGNVIRDVRRGYIENADEYGIGILVQGAGSNPSAPELIARNISITGNLLQDCRRGGISIPWGVDGVSVVGNQIINPGMPYTVAGNPTSASGGYHAFGVACPGAGVSGAWTTVKNVYVAANQILDNRATPAMKHGTWHGRAIPTWTDRNNIVTGAATAYTEFLPVTQFENVIKVGYSQTPAARVDIGFATASGSSGTCAFVAGATTMAAWTYTTSDNKLRLNTAPGGAGSVSSVAVDRDSGQWVFAYPPRVPRNISSNRPAPATAGAGALYLDSSLNKLLASDGVNWRDTMGTIV